MAELALVGGQSIPWDVFIRERERWRADAGLSRELADLLPGTTDDLPIP